MDILAKFSGSQISVIGTGYLGSRLYDLLQLYSKSYNYEVQAFSKKNIEDIRGGVFDFVFNCAGNTGDFRVKVWETLESNLFLTKYIFDNVEIKNTYIGLSSTRVYGFSDSPAVLFREEDINNNITNHLDLDFIYDGSKKLLESVLLNVSHSKPYKTVICRLSNIYGAYTKADLDDSTYVKVMLKHALSKDTLLVKQNICNSKGYIFIDDATEGIIRSALYAPQSTIYNICSGVSYSVKDWLAYLDVDYKYNSTVMPESYSKICIKKARTELLFMPKYFLNNLEFNKILKNGSN